MVERRSEVRSDVVAKARHSPFLRLFVLPVVQERRMPGGLLKAFCYPRFSKESDDTYIYYLLIIRGLVVSSFISLLYWISYAWDIRIRLGLFTIHIDPNNALQSMLDGYFIPVATIQLVIFLSYGWLLFRANIDLNTIDLLHWNSRLVQRVNGNRDRLLTSSLITTLVAFAASYFVCGPVAYLVDMHPGINNSSATLLGFLIFYAWIYSALPCAIVVGAATAYQQWRRLGPRYHQQSSNMENL
jgi:hypothetical protein